MAVEKVSDQLRRLIQQSSLSAYEVAKRAGVDESAIARFLSGERGLSLATVDAVGQLFEVSLKWKKPKERKSPMPTLLNPQDYRVRCVNNEFVGVIDSFPRDGTSFKQWEAALRARFERVTGKRVTLTHYRADSPDGKRRLPVEWLEKFGLAKSSV